jgi:hypothetical protein
VEIIQVDPIEFREKGCSSSSKAPNYCNKCIFFDSAPF